MTDLTLKAVAAKAALNPNPANAAVGQSARRRVPMTVPVQKLQVPDLPGHFLYWMKGTPERVAQALAAGYEFVSPGELQVNDTRLGSDGMQLGGTDLGDRVSVLASVSGGGEVGEKGEPLRLYLMKQKTEWHEEDQKILEDRNGDIATAMTANFRQGTIGGQAAGEQPADFASRYVRDAKVPDLFKRKGKK